MRIKSLSTLYVALLLIGCTGDPVSPVQDQYTFIRPANFPDAVYTFENNPVTEEGFKLGRALFYDPILSLDSTIACANCHQQGRSFSDPVHRFSKGVGDASGFRNAPALQNMAFQKNFFWDGGVSHLDFVPINAITSEVEMHETLSNVITKLRRSNRYGDIDSQKALHALSQFMSMMISSNSRYDKYIRNEGEQLTANELAGLKLFVAKCSSCHATDLFTDGSFRNNGLDISFEKDTGREKITENENDRGKFKVPSLRNAELTAPNMHDGRFKTLETVLDHYRNSIQQSATLDPLLKEGIDITDDEKTNIIAFIKTLTDKTFITDERFREPL